MNRKQNIDKDSFEQVSRDLLQKVRKAELPDPEEILLSWQEIDKQTSKPSVSFMSRIKYVLSAAASIAILFSIGFFFWDKNEDTTMSLTLLEKEVPSQYAKEIVLVAENEKMHLKDDSSIKYESDGKSNVGENVLNKETSDQVEKEKEDKINQIIVPKGRKANITFSDGTKIYVNAGTRVIYPAVFKKEKREILVEGEVFLEVAKDASRPFIVKTNGFDVEVLGTQFNICAYKEDPSASVVLVSGSVEVKTGKNENAKLVPNQLIEINENGTDIKNVDVFEYICWKDNMMLLNDRRAGEVFDKLARYYGRSIHYDNTVKEIPISGKLDLREEMEDVVNIMCQSLFLAYSVDENNNIVISK